MSEFDDPFEKGLDEEEADRALASKLVDEMNITPRSPEEIASTIDRLKKAGFKTASELLPPDPLESLPVSDEEAPPDEAVPAFIIVRDAYGPGSPSIKLPDGTPVGVWLDQSHHDLTGTQVTELLEEMGLDELYPGRSQWFGKTRDSRRTADDNILATPALGQLAASEAERRKGSEQVRAAYLEAHKKKEKGK